MRPALVLGLLGVILALRVVMGDPPASSFDTRFEEADAKLEALSEGIERDLAETRPPGTRSGKR